MIQEVTQERKSIRVGQTNGMIGINKVAITMTCAEKEMIIIIRTQDSRRSGIIMATNMTITTNTVKENTTALVAEAIKICKVSIVFKQFFSNNHILL